MLGQVGFILFLYCVGVLLASLFKEKVGFRFACLSGFIWGLLLWVLLGVLFIGTGIPYTFISMIGTLAAIGLVLLIINLRLNSFSRNELTWLSAAMGCFVIAAFLASMFNLSVLSADSFMQTLMGRRIAFHQGLSSATEGNLASWGIFVPMVQSTSVFLDLDYLYAVTPLLGLTFLCCFYYLCRRGLCLISDVFLKVEVLPILGTLALASSFFFVFQCFYIHNSLISAAYLFMFVVTAWLALAEKQHIWLVFSVSAIVGFSFSRTEGPAFAVIFLALLLASRELPYRIKLACILPYAAVTTLWYLRVLSAIGGGSDILAPDKVYVLLAGVNGLAVLVILSRLKLIDRLLRQSPWLMLYALATAVLILVVRNPGHMAENTYALVQNMFETGRWGEIWGILAILLVLSLLQPPIRGERLLSFGIAAFLITLFALGAFRIPFRIGFGDSANRMLTHILPVTILYVTWKGGAGSLKSATQEFVHRYRRRVLLAGLPLLIAMTYLTITRPVDYAIGAEVVEAPFFGSHRGVDVALRGLVDYRYAAATQDGPTTVVLDLGKPVTAEILEMTEYHPTQALLDYAWHVSPDRKRWTEVFDMRSGEETGVQHLDELTTRFSLVNKGTFRFVRLTFRSSLDQNRLLLKRISVYSKDFRNPKDIKNGLIHRQMPQTTLPLKPTDTGTEVPPVTTTD